MKNLATLLFCLSLSIIGQEVDASVVRFHGNYFHHIKGENNSKVLIFLHGGVTNSQFSDPSKIHETDFLLEGNELLIPTALDQKFDLLIPIKNDKLNWLTNHQYCFRVLADYLDSLNQYSTRYISGFSDGGTGSYKMFYDNTEYYDGLVVFNGFPQNKNFNKGVEYEKVKDKEVAFFSTFNDKIIPYEFLLMEYRKQKKSNANTYLYIKEGGHTYSAYDQNDLNLMFAIITSKTRNTKTETEPIHAFVKEDSMVEFYTFRKKINKKYGYAQVFETNKTQEKLHGNK